MIACGFDAGALDPLGRMLLPAAAFGAMTERLLDAAGRLCDGRLVASHEGGYSAGHVPFCGLSVIEALSGLSAGIDDPFAYLADIPGQELAAAPARRGRRCRGARRRGAALSDIKLVLVLSENWTLTPPRDLRGARRDGGRRRGGRASTR